MIFRGATVEFSSTFVDADGEPFTPEAAVLTINFRNLGGQRESVSIDLDPLDSTWTVNWDSSVAKPGMVCWSIKAFSGDLVVADDGDFCLSANVANTPESPTPTVTILTDESGNSLVTEDGDTITA